MYFLVCPVGKVVPRCSQSPSIRELFHPPVLFFEDLGRRGRAIRSTAFSSLVRAMILAAFVIILVLSLWPDHMGSLIDHGELSDQVVKLTN